MQASQPSYIDLGAIISSQNPKIDLQLDSYQESTRSFLKAVSGYANRATTEITRRRNEHASEKKKLAERKLQIETETSQCKVKEIELIQQLEGEQAERKEAETSLTSLKRQLASIREKCAAIDVEIEQYRSVAGNLRRERQREQSVLESFASRTSPELEVLQERLACVVEGIDKDKLLIRFTHLDPHNPEEEYTIVIDVSTRQYKVPTSTPMLPTLPLLVEELNNTRDVFQFIKDVRNAFKELRAK